MLNNLETSQIVVQDEQGNNQLVQAVANMSGDIVWSKGIEDAWCVVQDGQGNKQLALKTAVIAGGGEGSYVEQPTIVEDLTSSSITLDKAEKNTIYKYGTLTSLTVSANDISDEEIIIYFTAGNTITTSFPNTLKWVNDDELSPDANTNYVISIINNIAAWGSYN